MNELIEIKVRSSKYLEEYQMKIEECDVLLGANKQNRRKLRRGENCVFDLNDLEVEFARVSARRQCYVQFIHDLRYEILQEGL